MSNQKEAGRGSHSPGQWDAWVFLTTTGPDGALSVERGRKFELPTARAAWNQARRMAWELTPTFVPSGSKVTIKMNVCNASTWDSYTWYRREFGE